MNIIVQECDKIVSELNYTYIDLSYLHIVNLINFINSLILLMTINL